MSTYFLSDFLHKVQPVRLTAGLFYGEGYSEGQGVGEVGEIFWRGPGFLFMVEQLGCKNCCLWKNGLDGRHGHICEEVNETKYLWYDFFPLVFILFFLLCLNYEVPRFAYYGIMWEYCEGTPCSYPLSKSSVAASRLNSVGLCEVLEWITCRLSPRQWDTSPVKGIGVSDTGCYFMPLGATWGLDLGGRSWGHSSSEDFPDLPG